MYFIASSFSEWSPTRRTGSDEIDSFAQLLSVRTKVGGLLAKAWGSLRSMTNSQPEPQLAPAAEQEPAVRRMNWGCGNHVEPGWINSDIDDTLAIDISCDIRDGLPLDDDHLDYIVSIHALQEIPYGDLLGALSELRRVLKPGGVLRLCLPDLERGIEAFHENDRDYFLVPDEDAATIGGKLVTQLIWYGWSRSLFTYDFTEELLQKAGFRDVVPNSFRRTESRFPQIVDLDSRERESLFVEATK
jgi:SAM-dependent methyltransferase